VDPLLRLSATKLAAMIRAREVTSREVVDAHIARIELVNPVLNAVVADRFARARAEADAADARARAAGAGDGLPPLFGVPCTIKECFRLEGMPNSSGLVARKDVRADGDATAVARLRAAGAIPMGVTNVSELCMWYETNNRVYGRTNNPYDPSRIVGGSSGGEGAIVAAGASPFGLGSDVGGSIRMPAFFNGVFGHKPTGGLVPGSGQFPMAENEAQRYLTTGPLCRRAEDLAPLVRLLAGPDGIDGGCVPMELGDPARVDLRALTVVDVEDNGEMPVSEDLRGAQRRAAEHLADAGARVVRARVPSLRRSRDIWSAMLGAAGATEFGTLLGNGTPIRVVDHLLPWIFRRSPHTMPALVLAALERMSKKAKGRIARAVAHGRELRRALVELIGPSGVMLFPPFPTAAPRHYTPMLQPFRFVYTAIFNVMELPVTQVPLGLNDEGLPIGVQVVGVHGNDHLTMAAALELERAFGGWVPPTGEAWTPR
jgi:fatty acid amide hydrolase 2